MKLAALLFLLLLKCSAQTISPIVVECSRKCSGEFTVTNNQTVPSHVVLQAQSFSLKDGQTKFRDLDKTVDLQLDAMSARLAPLDSRTFGYRMKCAQYPCLVTVIAMMPGPKSPDGLQVVFGLPFSIYQCEQKKDCRKNVRKEAGIE